MDLEVSIPRSLAFQTTMSSKIQLCICVGISRSNYSLLGAYTIPTSTTSPPSPKSSSLTHCPEANILTSNHRLTHYPQANTAALFTELILGGQ